MQDRPKVIASISLIVLGVLLIPAGHVRVRQDARQRLDLFEYESWKEARREAPRRSVAVVEAAPSEDGRGRVERRVVGETRGLLRLMQVPRTGQMVDLSTGDAIDDWYVAELQPGEVWESRQGRAVQLSGDVLYNLASRPSWALFGAASTVCGLALFAWRRADARGVRPQRLVSSDPQYAKCSVCGFEQWASYESCQRCRARFERP